MAIIGATLTDVLRSAWLDPFTTKSDYARAEADMIAMAASDGLLTTKLATGLYGNTWRVTSDGLNHLNRMTEGFRYDE